MMQIQQQILQLVFQDNKPRTVLDINHFGDILFKEKNKAGETYKILQIYIDGNNLEQVHRFEFQLQVIGKNEKEYHRFLGQGESFSEGCQPELYREVMMRCGLYGELKNIKSKEQDEVYMAAITDFADADYEDFHVLPISAFYEKVLNDSFFDEETLCDLTEIDSLNEKPFFYIQKLYWGHGVSRNTDGLYKCTNLHNLSIWGEPGGYLNEDIAKLQNLSVLSTRNMMKLPTSFLDHIHTLHCLVSLTIGRDPDNDSFQLEEIPPKIDQLQCLKYLDLEGNRLYGLTKISTLKTLKELTLQNNKLTGLNGISNLKQLRTLNISDNYITELPEELKTLSNLKILNLSKNPLKEIPDWLCEMTQLEELYLTQTQLKTLPENILRLSHLKVLGLKKNPFSLLPRSMLKISKRILDLELYNVALYDEKAKDKMAKYPTGDCLFEADFNFKLMVVQKLMYEEEVLLPKFDIWDFAKDEDIDIENDGYDVILKAVEYFKNLPVPMKLLNDIKELLPDGGDAIYTQIIPFWDGEDDTFQVKNIGDIKYLPQLKRTNSLNFKKEQIKQLRADKVKVSSY